MAGGRGQHRGAGDRRLPEKAGGDGHPQKETGRQDGKPGLQPAFLDGSVIMAYTKEKILSLWDLIKCALPVFAPADSITSG